MLRNVQELQQHLEVLLYDKGNFLLYRKNKDFLCDLIAYRTIELQVRENTFVLVQEDGAVFEIELRQVQGGRNE